MIVYVDASALVKRYVDEPGSDLVRQLMTDASAWFVCRIGFVETIRAVTLAAGERAARVVREEWPAFGILEVDRELVEAATRLALRHRLRSLDALHLAAALVLPGDGLRFATWDERLAAAAGREGLPVSP